MDEIAINEKKKKRWKECLDFREIDLDHNHSPFCVRNSTIQDGRSTLSVIYTEHTNTLVQ